MYSGRFYLFLLPIREMLLIDFFPSLKPSATLFHHFSLSPSLRSFFSHFILLNPYATPLALSDLQARETLCFVTNDAQQWKNHFASTIFPSSAGVKRNKVHRISMPFAVRHHTTQKYKWTNKCVLCV